MNTTLPVVSGRPRSPAHARVEANLGLVRSVLSRRFSAILSDPERREDAYVEGTLALARAAERYDPSQGTAFSTYAVACIEGAILRFLAQERRHSRLPTLSLDAPVGDDDGNCLHEQIEDKTADLPGERLFSQAGFSGLLSDLPPLHRRLMDGLYAEGRTLEDMARELRITRTRGAQIHATALRRIRYCHSAPPELDAPWVWAKSGRDHAPGGRSAAAS